MSGFHNIVFDEKVSYGSTGGPVYNTTVISLNNGFEQRNQNWEHPLSSWSFQHVIESSQKLDYLKRFFHARRGKAYAFLFKDWSDYKVRKTPDSTYNEGTLSLVSTGYYQLQKFYNDGVSSYTRTIKRIKNGTVKVYNSSDVELSITVDNDTGIVHIASGTPSYWTGEFYVKGRFDFDDAQFQLNNTTYGFQNSIKVIEVRE